MDKYFSGNAFKFLIFFNLLTFSKEVNHTCSVLWLAVHRWCHTFMCMHFINSWSSLSWQRKLISFMVLRKPDWSGLVLSTQNLSYDSEFVHLQSWYRSQYNTWMLLYAYELKNLPVPASRSVSQLRCHMQALTLQYTTQHKLYKESMFYGYVCVFKGIVQSLTNGIIYSPLCCSEPVWLSVICGTQKEKFLIMLFSMKLHTRGSFLASKGMQKNKNNNYPYGSKTIQ